MKKNNQYLLIINPFSGNKKGNNIGQNIQKRFKQHSLNLTTIITEYKGHAKKLLHKINPQKYTDILIVGGDGTFNEVINGLLNRKDAYRPTLGFIPGGTGNSLMHDLNCLDPIEALAPIFNHSIKYLDVMQLSINGYIEYAFNIIGWGAATDIGKSAEYVRWAGKSRYTLASLYNIILLKKRYANVIIDNNQLNKKFIFILACNTRYTGTGMLAAPKAKLDDGVFDIIILNQEITRIEMLQLLPKIFTGEHIYSEHVDYIQARSLQLTPNINESLNIDGEVRLKTPFQIAMLPKAISFYAS